ncbi:YbbC (macronuclear) [Tetrahymena thermophila SB210]|uniref:YbbC n=1 Tax=Tetrahymena thermophila (strain SB210) TaxID=312017 RepID=Q240Z3_TETTS|nr:YbbC [Tetrahymena thermophila SB210]EAS02271.1 YbbC [Tetrahymena thermophila SB210]|eukprot:XP_001022516.1 YbbC [Tetrahymena thermophila SB210]
MKQQSFFVVILMLLASQIQANLQYNSTNYDVQTQELLTQISGKRIGILTNPSCIDSSRELLFDVLFKNQNIYNFTLEYALAPEHGIRGDQDAGALVYDYVDPQTNITVYSLYGTRKQPTAEMLQKVDTIVHCIVDVGTRFFTYIWTMSYAQEAVGDYNFNLTQNTQLKNNFQLNNLQRKLSSNFKEIQNNDYKKEISFIVVDRPNVLGGEQIQGCPLEIESGYIGRLFNQNFTIPTRYAMTTGELATLFNEEYLPHKINDFKVIKILNYYRNSAFPNASLWINPSPNMKTYQTAYVYPGTGVFEQTNLSEGRGTNNPFQTIGAPFVNGTLISQILTYDNTVNQYAQFTPVTFIPTASKWVNETCSGIQITVIDKERYDSVFVGTRIMQVLLQQYPENMTLTKKGSCQEFGTINFYNQITNKSITVKDILDSCSNNLKEWEKIREKYLIYN